MTRRPIVPALFLVVAVAVGVRGAHAGAQALAHPGLKAALVVVYFALRTAVALAFAFFTMGRTEPRERARSALALFACAIAMTAVIAFDAPSANTSSAFVLAGDLVAVVSCLWLLAAVMTLGRCFGVLPEARGLVTVGPYRLIRHPVYLGEIGACVGLALAAPSALNVVVLAVFMAAQAVRMRLEERALTLAFPEYARYAARTPRLIPRIRRPRTAYPAVMVPFPPARATEPSSPSV